MLPNFLVPGAYKSATSWLHACFLEHPEIYVPEWKEVRFFSHFYDKGFEWYQEFFKEYRGEKAVGEVSPTYMRSSYPFSVERIHKFNPDLKLIFILRNPIDRAYSAYCAMYRAGTLTETPDKIFLPESVFLEDGMYYKRMEPFLNRFPKENIKVLIYEDMKKDAESFLKDAFTFLEVDPDFKPEIMNRVLVGRKPLPKNMKFHQFLLKFRDDVIKKSDLLFKIYASLHRRGMTNIIHKFSAGTEYPPIADETRNSMMEYFQPDVEALSQLVDRDLSFWLKIEN